MTYILFGLGILFILLGFIDVFPKVKQSYLDTEDLYKWQKQKSEVNQAKEDLMELMVELRRVSDQVVENIEYKINEAKNLKVAPVYQNLTTKSDRLDKSFNDETKIAKQDTEIINEIKARANVTQVKNRDDNKVTPKGNKGLKPKSDAILEEIPTANHLEVKPTLDKHSYIYQLAKEGLSIEEIAQKVQVGKGEVELIIGIKRRGEQS